MYCEVARLGEDNMAVLVEQLAPHLSASADSPPIRDELTYTHWLAISQNVSTCVRGLS